MAHSDHVDLTDAMVEVYCNNSEQCLKVHEGLLTRYAPLLVLQRHVLDEVDHAEVNASLDVFQIFGRWLYYHEVLEGADQSQETVEQLLEAHALGREVGCLEFMYTILDDIMSRVTHQQYEGCLDEIVGAFLAEFQPRSGGWKFMVDYVVHYRDLACDDSYCECWREANKMEDNDFLTEVARKTLLGQGLKKIRNPKFCKKLINRLAEARQSTDDAEIPQYPWRWTCVNIIDTPNSGRNAIRRSIAPNSNRSISRLRVNQVQGL